MRGAIMPLFKEIVQALSQIDKNDIDYIILYNRGSHFTFFHFEPTVIAIRTGNIEKHLIEQNFAVYEYAGEDWFQTESRKYIKGRVIPPSETGDGTYRVPAIKPNSSPQQQDEEVRKALKVAFYASQNGKPFAATRIVQWALSVFGPYIEKMCANGDCTDISLKKQLTQDEWRKRETAFETEYPLLSGEDKTHDGIE